MNLPNDLEVELPKELDLGLSCSLELVRLGMVSKNQYTQVRLAFLVYEMIGKCKVLALHCVTKFYHCNTPTMSINPFSLRA